MGVFHNAWGGMWTDTVKCSGRVSVPDALSKWNQPFHLWGEAPKEKVVSVHSFIL